MIWTSSKWAVKEIRRQSKPHCTDRIRAAREEHSPMRLNDVAGERWTYVNNDILFRLFTLAFVLPVASTQWTLLP